MKILFKRLLSVFLAAILLVPTLSVHATERDGMTEEKAVEIADNMFENIDASQKILKPSAWLTFFVSFHSIPVRCIKNIRWWIFNWESNRYIC